MAEFKDCPRGLLDRECYYGGVFHTNAYALGVADIFDEIGSCGKRFICSSKLCETLIRKGLTHTASTGAIKTGEIQCNSQADLRAIIKSSDIPHAAELS